jgi:hypothetical protein
MTTTLDAYQGFMHSLRHAGVHRPAEPCSRSRPAAPATKPAPARGKAPTLPERATRAPAPQRSAPREVRLLPLGKASGLSGLSEEALRRLSAEGKLRGFVTPRHVGRQVLVRMDDLVEAVTR